MGGGIPQPCKSESVGVLTLFTCALVSSSVVILGKKNLTHFFRFATLMGNVSTSRKVCSVFSFSWELNIWDATLFWKLHVLQDIPDYLFSTESDKRQSPISFEIKKTFLKSEKK